MRKQSVAAIFIAAFMVGAGPETRPVHSMGDVDANYSDCSAIAKREYDNEMSKAADERLQSLRLLQDRAIKDQDLDQAIAIKNRIEQLKSSGNSETGDIAKELLMRRRSEDRVAGSRWHDVEYPNEFWTLGKDGSVLRSDGAFGEWVAITPAKFMVRLTAPDHQWLYVWTFNDDFTSFSDQHGKISEEFTARRVQ